MKKLKKFLKKNKGIIRLGSIIPLVVFISGPIGLAMFAFQLICFLIMFWIGFNFEN